MYISSKVFLLFDFYKLFNFHLRILNGNHFTQYDLETQLKLLLENKPLFANRSHLDGLISSIFDGQVYKEWKENNEIFILTNFSDGIRFSKLSSNELWPSFIKVNDLDCNKEDKFVFIFLWGNQT